MEPFKSAMSSGDSYEARLLTQEELEQHLAIDTYGDFQLTDAIRPGHYKLGRYVVPTEGYCHYAYVDEENGGAPTPVIMAAASREKLYKVFTDFVQLVGSTGTVDVVLETSHNSQDDNHEDFYQEEIDIPFVLSKIIKFEDMLTNDGCTGITVLNPDLPQEVHLDEHKLLVVYGHDLQEYEKILERHGIRCNEQILFINEGQHIHASTDEYRDEFLRLRIALGLDEWMSVFRPPRNLLRDDPETDGGFTAV